MRPRLLSALAAFVIIGGSLLGQQPARTSSTGAQSSQRVQVDADSAAALLRKSIAPDYPADAQKKGIQGVVKLKIFISRSGDVTQAKLISGHPLLAQAAINAVRQWKYQPYLQNGRPVSVETEVSVSFPPASNPGADAEPPNFKMPAIYTGRIVSITKRRPDGTLRADVASEFARSLLIKEVPPAYPDTARDQHIPASDVVVKAVVSKEGDVIDVQLVSGNPPFTQPALDAVKQWKYKPFLSDGNAIEFETEIRLEFTRPAN